MNVKGENFILYAFEGGVWIGYACSTSMFYEITTDFIEISSSGTGKNAAFLPTKNSFTASADGIVALNETDKLTFPELQQKQLAHELMLLRFQETDEGGNVYTKECTAYISNSSESGSYDGMDSFTISFRGTGEITQIFAAVPPIPDSLQPERYEFTASGGETSITDAALIGREILEFNKDGVSFSPVITSGTPINKEVKYLSGTGYLEWGIPAEPGEEFYIVYQ